MAATYETEETSAGDLGALLDAGDGATVTLAAGGTRLVVHRAVLAARSPVFAAMFRHDMLEARSGWVQIADVEGPVLRQLVAYVYTLKAPQLPGMAPQLLAAADKYGLSGLKDACEEQVAGQLTVENAAATAVLALSHCCSGLKGAAVAFVKDHFHRVAVTRGWADAVLRHPHFVAELTRLIAQPPVRPGQSLSSNSCSEQSPGPHVNTLAHSDHGQTPATAAPPAAAPDIPPLDAATVSRMRNLSAWEKRRRLTLAAKEGSVAELRALLAGGAALEVRDGSGKTALHWAAKQGHLEAVRCLVGGGAQVGARDHRQQTPLHAAAGGGHTAVVRLLVEASADPDARDQRGSTPLHLAARWGHAEPAAALLAAGADRLARDDVGDTPLDEARLYSHQQLVQLLT
ncbi:ankyrin-3-like [Schistocerca piceifrons]|uniref:ankyrin-3-like n=1 Tax=Schistocerca piceifrons TaxID=274613 RepID=UPI001F5E76D4|nr:ankyrin-3-like [Schistocerca piceifrons]